MRKQLVPWSILQLLELLLRFENVDDRARLAHTLNQATRRTPQPHHLRTRDYRIRQSRMTGGIVIRQGPEGTRILARDPMDGDENIPRNPDGLYVEAVSVSVCV